MNRINVVDALRGFAIVATLLLYNIEHFGLYWFPDYSSEWMKSLDIKVWDTLFFIFEGKAYSIFALLFGFTYYIQYSKQEKLGKDFSGKFAWRMLILLGFGLFNSLFYAGDILTIYALVGCILIPVRKLKTKWIVVIATILIFQPIEWVNALISYFYETPVIKGEPFYRKYYHMMYETLLSSNFFTMIFGNITHGRLATLLWNWDHGRFFQTAGLFMFGYILGRSNLLIYKIENMVFWKKVLLISLACFILLFAYSQYFYLENVRWEQIVLSITKSWANLSFSFILISSFILLYYHGWRKILKFFRPLGKMSLTCYVTQSVLGSFVYYQYGLGLYQYTGATLAFLIGIGLCLVQWHFCKWWLKDHKKGPLEKIWHNLTWGKNPQLELNEK